MFIEIDNCLFDRVFEKFAHWFQRLTGKTNFWLATISGMTEALILGFLSIEHLKKGDFPFFFFLGFCSLALMSTTIPAVNSFEKEFYCFNKGDHCGMNPLRTKFLFYRAFSAFFLAVTVVILLLRLCVGDTTHIWEYVFWVGFNTGMTAKYYFSSCTPLPPGTSKFRELLNKTLWKLNDALAPKSEPVPNV